MVWLPPGRWKEKNINNQFLRQKANNISQNSPVPLDQILWKRKKLELIYFEVLVFKKWKENLKKVANPMMILRLTGEGRELTFFLSDPCGILYIHGLSILKTTPWKSIISLFFTLETEVHTTFIFHKIREVSSTLSNFKVLIFQLWKPEIMSRLKRKNKRNNEKHWYNNEKNW